MYVDGFILPVPKKLKARYIKTARACGKVWLSHGALQYVECQADDVKKGKLTSFPQSVKLKAGEEVYFSWIVYKSRRDRDRILAKVMKDPIMTQMGHQGFDMKRIIFGGFKQVVLMEK